MRRVALPFLALLALASAGLRAQEGLPQTATAPPKTASAAQPAPPPAAPTADARTSTDKDAPPLKTEELEQLVAPIALYPDSLLAQVFMASTYPLEIVYAARWSKANSQVKGEAAVKAVENEDWDASVKALVAFPEVVTMMNDKLDWTQKLGDAFLAQKKDVMDAVQRLRMRAKDEGNLKSGKEQTVKTEAAPAGSATPQVIVIESPDPQVVYVPTYNPTVVYGAWPYPAYPPYYYYPPGYMAGAAFMSFSFGVFVGSAMWGGCNWGHSDIDIDVNRYNNFNRNSTRNINDRSWRHDASHRRGVGYRDSASQQRYGNWGNQQGIQSREEFRGRAEAGRDQMARDGGLGNQGGPGGDRGIGDGSGAGNRDFGGGQNRDLGTARDGGLDSSGRDFGTGRDGGLDSSGRDFGTGRDGGLDSSGRDLSTGRDGGFDSSGRDYGGSPDYGGGRDYSTRSSGAFEGVGNGAGTRMSSSRGAASRGGGGFSRGGGGGRRR